MNKYDLIQKLNKNGYLFTSDIVNAGISKTYLAKYIKDNDYERVAHGVYASPDTWPDDLFLLSLAYNDIIFSGETALFLHGLVDREYEIIEVSVPAGFNGQRLRNKSIKVHTERPALYGMGKTTIETQFGNTVSVYNKERCICDTVKNRKAFDVQTYQTALKEYFRSNDKDFTLLLQYSETLGIKEEIKKYAEVML